MQTQLAGHTSMNIGGLGICELGSGGGGLEVFD